VKRRILYFTAPGQLEVREQDVPAPAAHELLVQTVLSAISAGTEMLLYRGEFPRGLSDLHDAVSGALSYPTTYGYAAVGRVLQVGKSVDPHWENRLVFGFQPHCSHFVATPESLLPVPEDMQPEDGIFLPNTETAVNLVQDAKPMLGERALVLGQGVVGLLTAALLHQFPLERLTVADRYEIRRQAALDLGVSLALDPALGGFREAAKAGAGVTGDGYDLTIELTGSPSALNDSIELTGFSGRVVIGSWYGEKEEPIALGRKFHRARMSLISSQVSTISPSLTGRWDKSRRYEVAWKAVRSIRPATWITQRISFADAAAAYQLLDEFPERTIQIVLSY
jgi:2-desacetyl-2-hydroxyethyl bacteriochlorophyllide A dehydrogenase